MIISLARQLIFLLPIAWLLSLSGELRMVWWAFPIAEVASMILSIVFFHWTYRKHITPLVDIQS
jgi:Na+-driven multidrug efflux pump